jgi:hypothetical protein
LPRRVRGAHSGEGDQAIRSNVIVVSGSSR